MFFQSLKLEDGFCGLLDMAAQQRAPLQSLPESSYPLPKEDATLIMQKNYRSVRFKLIKQ